MKGCPIDEGKADSCYGCDLTDNICPYEGLSPEEEFDKFWKEYNGTSKN